MENKNLGNKIDFAYNDSFLDSEDLEKINKKINSQILQLRAINLELRKHERLKADLTVKRNHKYRLTYLSKQDSKNETQRRILSEIDCEELDSKLIYEEQMIEELKRMGYSLRVELECLKTIGANIRQGNSF